MPRLGLSATVLDARDPIALAGFYQALLGWETAAQDPTWCTLRAPGGGAGLSFQLEPVHEAPTWPAREGAGQMQMHLDIGVDDLDAAAELAISLGAREASWQPQPEVRVMLDPEGHPFCLFPFEPAS
ncbi:VOC family protein [Isoptericola sp. b441]|uniref:VOC family protein n=1 Tax=Actinotalea lenta TaxID=3064654 RepID=A0ABT9D7V7_9CELL|nr:MULTISPECIES: VOC family protein [unclassified Isoptericola]MDO8106954.1 VOC family protein [Isoptericola sp. b441]MDO8121336.1 VOC family protein [Isoptericola sp. b490]